jgi:hypothetical protein
MSNPEAEAAAAGSSRKKESRTGLYVGVILLIALVVAAAAYQETLGYLINLRVWDKRAPAAVVEQFLEAAQRGDQEAAGRYLQLTGSSPLVKDGKWLGYIVPAGFVPTQTHLDDILPEGNPKAGRTEFVFKGDGAADVWAPNRKGEEVKYRLKRVDGAWKITEIESQRLPE